MAQIRSFVAIVHRLFLVFQKRWTDGSHWVHCYVQTACANLTMMVMVFRFVSWLADVVSERSGTVSVAVAVMIRRTAPHFNTYSSVVMMTSFY